MPYTPFSKILLWLEKIPLTPACFPEMLADADSLDENSIVFINSIEFFRDNGSFPVLEKIKSSGGYVYSGKLWKVQI